MMRRDDISLKEKMQSHQGLAPTFHAMVDELQRLFCRKNTDAKCQSGDAEL
ncbi:hypothetical protein B0G81_5403 [Paraburkholderia sp. BL6665CI2N2]|nr:hypothetical protein B0G81_5403 [Paraburkholderia sp. BL6665CI2N2]